AGILPITAGAFPVDVSPIDLDVSLVLPGDEPGVDLRAHAYCRRVAQAYEREDGSGASATGDDFLSASAEPGARAPSAGHRSSSRMAGLDGRPPSVPDSIAD